MDYDRRKAARLLSAMHKHVRRSRPLEAMAAAYRLARMSEPNAWSELRTIAMEDVEQPLETVAVEYLNTWRKEPAQSGREKFGKRCLALMTGIKILAEANKDRRADELLNLFKKAKGLPAKTVLKAINDRVLFPDEVDDGHTVEGRRKHRGNDFFVKEGSKCTNMVPAYAEWHDVWEGIMLQDISTASEKPVVIGPFRGYGPTRRK